MRAGTERDAAVEEIRRFVVADSPACLSLASLRESVAAKKNGA